MPGIWFSFIPRFLTAETETSQQFLDSRNFSQNRIKVLHGHIFWTAFMELEHLEKTVKGREKEGMKRRWDILISSFPLCPCGLPMFRKLTERQTFELQIGFETLNMHIIGYFITNYFCFRELLLSGYFLWLEYYQTLLRDQPDLHHKT